MRTRLAAIREERLPCGARVVRHHPVAAPGCFRSSDSSARASRWWHRKVRLEVQDVVDVGAAPAVDRLVLVTDREEVLALARPAASRDGTARGSCPGTRRSGGVERATLLGRAAASGATETYRPIRSSKSRRRTPRAPPRSGRRPADPLPVVVVSVAAKRSAVTKAFFAFEMRDAHRARREVPGP